MAADDALIGPIASGARARLERIKAALVREMTMRLQRLDTKGGKLSSERESLDAARKIRTQVLQLLREEGYPLVIDAAEQAVADAVERALGPVQAMQRTPLGVGMAVTLDAEAKDSIARSVSGVLDEVAGVFGDAAQEIRRAVDASLNTAAPLGDLIEEVRARLDTTFLKASTAVDLAVRSAGQKAINDQAERGAEATGIELVAIYSGPSDSKVRDWCDEHLDKAYTVDGLRRLRNDNGEPAAEFRGSFGCRHRWEWTDRESFEASGGRVEA